jgi:hypothetical protein
MFVRLSESGSQKNKAKYAEVKINYGPLTLFYVESNVLDELYE